MSREPVREEPRQETAIPLEHLSVEADIKGTVARVTLTQRFGNRLLKPVEAVYTFPLPADAQVDDVRLRIGGRELSSRIDVRQEAREDYERARDRGHHVALVEQERENIFTASVAGIEPGESIEVVLTYLQQVTWQGGGRFTHPLTIAPRFISGTPTGKQGTGTAPDTDEVPDASRISPPVVGAVPYTADFVVALEPGFHARVSSPSHPDRVEGFQMGDRDRDTLHLKDVAPDRDFILVYATQEPQPAVKLDHFTFVPNAPEGHSVLTEHFVMLQLMAGAADEPRTPLDVIMLLDGSGSMKGGKMEGLHKVAKRVLGRLRELRRPVRVGIIEFDNQPTERASLSEIGDQHLAAIDQVAARGGTEIGGALTYAMNRFGDENDDRERCIILVSDGDSGGANYRAKPGVRVHSIGIDSAVNDALLKDIARDTGGVNQWLYPGEPFDAVAGRLASLAQGPVARGVSIEGLPAGAEVVGLADLYAGEPTIIVMRSTVEALSGFSLRYRGPDGASFERKLMVPARPTPADIGAKLWAKMKLREERDPAKQTQISLRYRVLGPTTAFVVVARKEVPGEKPEEVVIPTAMPAGWECGGDDGMAFATLCSAAPASAAFMPRVPQARRAPAVRRMAGVPAFRGASLESMVGSRSMDAGAELSKGFDDLGDEESVSVSSVAPTPSGVGDSPQALKLAEALLIRVKAPDKMDDEITRLVSEFEVVLMEAVADSFSRWSELDRARLYLVFTEVLTLGVKTSIPIQVKTCPRDADAYRLWRQAEQKYASLGQP